MRLTSAQMQGLVEKVFDHWKKQNMVVFKEDEKKVFARALEAVRVDYQKEIELEKEVQKMLNDLERTHGRGFEKNKMYNMLKQKLAKERKIVL